ncbi:MAG: hypothetical protein GIX02_07490 [Candidatus Eremiobacteraeota bacterium]|nr:hypothetical protein [Candidatus Eremiobacteraeota bacterium]
MTQPGTTTGTSFGAAGEVEVYSLKAAVPGLNGAPSTTATDIATTVTQALSSQAPDLKITVPPSSSELVLTGSQYSIKLAKDLINQLDTAQPLVVLDTEVLEVDETVAKNLGLQLTQPVVGSTFHGRFSGRAYFRRHATSHDRDSALLAHTALDRLDVEPAHPKWDGPHSL